MERNKILMMTFDNREEKKNMTERNEKSHHQYEDDF